MLKVLREVYVSLFLGRRYVLSSVYAPGVLIAASYLDVEVLIDFDDVAKEENVLHQTSKLPHIPQVLQRLGGLGGHLWLGRDIELGLFRRALVARHCESESWASRTVRCEGWAGQLTRSRAYLVKDRQ